MENVTDALIMAASVLMLIIALSVSISSFSRMRTQVDYIVSSSDETQLAKDQNQNYINYIKNSNDVRTVGAETLISSIRRVEKENYKIYIVTEKNTDLGIKVSKAIEQKYNETTLVAKDATIYEISLSGKNNNISKILTKDFYTKVKKMKFKEYLGIYQNNTNVSEENKETYRIITYVEVQ